MALKILKWILAVSGFGIMMSLLFLFYMGFFSSLKISEREMGPYTYVYERHIGPYSQTGTALEKLEKELKEAGIESDSAIGIYHDNPAMVPADRLRSDIGIVISEKDSAKISSLKGSHLVGHMPRRMCIVAEFPVKNRVSYMIGPMKGYTALTDYANTHRYPLLAPYELYPPNLILFVMEIQR